MRAVVAGDRTLAQNGDVSITTERGSMIALVYRQRGEGGAELTVAVAEAFAALINSKFSN